MDEITNIGGTNGRSLTGLLADALEKNVKLVAALKAVLEATPQEQCGPDCDVENCPWMQARAALKEIGEL